MKRLDGICTVTLAAMLLQSPVTLPSWELHRQVHRAQRKIEDRLGKMNHIVKAMDTER